jgi:hypothetical protein
MKKGTGMRSPGAGRFARRRHGSLGGRCRARQQVGQRQRQAGDDAGAQRCPGGGLRVVGDLRHRGAGRRVRAFTLHVVREGIGTERDNQVVAGKSLDDLLAHRRQPAGE